MNRSGMKDDPFEFTGDRLSWGSEELGDRKIVPIESVLSEQPLEQIETPMPMTSGQKAKWSKGGRGVQRG